VFEMNREDIEHSGAMNVSDLLRIVSGVEVRRQLQGQKRRSHLFAAIEQSI
jgi:outer membrane cobalamin receptor